MIDVESLPTITDRQSAEWALRIINVLVHEEVPVENLDLVERMIQAIRNEAAREVCLQVERTVALDCWREP